MLCLVGAVVPLTGCFHAGMGIEPALDRTLVTSAIPANLENLTDDDLITLAVAGARAGEGTTQHIRWTNPRTGDGGIVSYVRESANADAVCRSFVVSKHRYDGVALYRGKICRSAQDDDWVLQSIEERI